MYELVDWALLAADALLTVLLFTFFSIVHFLFDATKIKTQNAKSLRNIKLDENNLTEFITLMVSECPAVMNEITLAYLF